MGLLPERILLATDGSEDAARATEAAWDLASRGGAELHVIHVWHDVRGFAHDFVKGELKRQGQEVLDGQVEKLRSAGARSRRRTCGADARRTRSSRSAGSSAPGSWSSAAAGSAPCSGS